MDGETGGSADRSAGESADGGDSGRDGPDVQPDLYREVLGRLPTGVTLVTGLADGEPLGIVIGSFVSVSMDPPLVGFLPGKSSRTWPRIEDTGSFCVNVLSDQQADLSNSFYSRDGGAWEESGWVPAPSGSPAIPTCAAWIDCQVHEVVDAGDHWFVMGRVTHLEPGGAGSPLVFLGGRYGTFSGLG